MTARDMEAEQNYTIGRQNLLTRNVLGEGLVCGMNVTQVEVRNQKLYVTLDPGVALDRCGNPIVVTKTEPVAATRGAAGDAVLPDGNEISLYVKFVECEKESVAIPHSENPCKEECCYNRTLETFKVFFEESAPNPPIPKSVEELTFPTPEEVTADRDRALGQIARSYYRRNRKECKDSTNPIIFLGKWKEDPPESGIWVVAEEDTDGPTGNDSPAPLDRPHVYNNDMLYAAISRHTADFDNPHRVTAAQIQAVTSVDGVERDEDGDIDLTSDNDTISISPNETEHEINLETSAKQLDALQSVEEVRRDENGNVNLTSDNNSITISTNQANHAIDFGTSAEQIGALESINNVQSENGNITLTSQNGTVTITPNDEADTIDLSASARTQQPEVLKCVDFDGFLPNWLRDCEPIAECKPDRPNTAYPLKLKGVSVGSNREGDVSFISSGNPEGLVKLDLEGEELDIVQLSEDEEDLPLMSYAEIEVAFYGFPEGPNPITLQAFREDEEVYIERRTISDMSEYRYRFRVDPGEDFDRLHLPSSPAWAVIEVCTRRTPV